MITAAIALLLLGVSALGFVPRLPWWVES